MENLRSAFVSILAVALTAAIHSQLVDTKFEGYTKFLSAIILLLLLVSPIKQFIEAATESAAMPKFAEIELSTAEPEDYFLKYVKNELELSLKKELSGELDMSPNLIAVDVQLDRSDSSRLCVGKIVVNIDGEVDTGDILRKISQKYETDDVSVNSGA